MSIELTITDQHADDLDEQLLDAITDATEDQTTQEGYDFFRAMETRCKMMADALWYDLAREAK